MVYLTIEGSFLIANLHKFKNGGWFTLLLASLYFLVMLGWYYGRKIKNRYITFADLDKYLDLFRDLTKDESVPKFATNLVYIIRANRTDQVESKIVYSIFHKQPKRADTYWLLHVNMINEPKRFDYQVKHIIPGLLIRIDFNIGFKVEPKINLYFREVIEDLVKSGEIKISSNYESLRKHNVESDFKFIIIDRIMSRDFKLSTWENFILTLNSIVRRLSISGIRTLNLDSTNTIVEQVPITLDQPLHDRIRRIE
jgi:KUP system potassium uptake protein